MPRKERLRKRSFNNQPFVRKTRERKPTWMVHRPRPTENNSQLHQSSSQESFESANDHAHNYASELLDDTNLMLHEDVNIIDDNDEQSPLYENSTASITKSQSKSIILKFLCAANLNDVQKLHFFNVVKQHLPKETEIDSSWLPRKYKRTFAVRTTESDDYVLFDVESQVQNVTKNLNIQGVPLRRGLL